MFSNKASFKLEPVPKAAFQPDEKAVSAPFDSNSNYEIIVEKKVEKKPDKNVRPSFKELWANYPKSVFCIVGNEFCERFCYYGMVTILALYLVNVLKLPSNEASVVYHAFIVLCYFSPLFGSILADGFIGKYHTIMWVSLFYASGNIVLSVAAYFDPDSPTHPGLDYLGLFMIAMGTGGIKPCVSSFGGDQFKKGQEKSLEMFFSIFYFSINAGSFISTILTPLLRVRSCFGQDTCYSLAFGVPAVLMIVAVILFAAGTPLYKRYPPKGNLLVQIFKVCGVAIRNKTKSKEKRKHWLDYYLDTHDCEKDPLCRELGTCQKVTFLGDIRSVLRVLVMFLPVPFFWALYDQQGDRWTLQGTTMNGKYGSFRILPDQMGAVNTILIMSFIPLFQGIIYPLVSKCVKLTLLRKMAFGGFLGALSYVVCGLVQLKINTTLPVLPSDNTAFLTVLNYASCGVTTTSVNFTNIPLQAASMGYTGAATIPSVYGTDEMYQLNITGNCLPNGGYVQQPVYLSDSASTYVVVTDEYAGWNYADLQKSTQGEGQFKISVNYFADNPNVEIINNNTVNFAWCTQNATMTNLTEKCNTRAKYVDNYMEVSATVHGGSVFVELQPQKWYLYVMYEDGAYYNTMIEYDQENQGGIYTMTVLNGNETNSFTSEVYQVASDNSISIFWQLPQYIVITAAEILFSITGLEFSFTQAPLSMKSVMMACWLLTDAIGNVIIIFIDEVNFFSNIAYLFFLFAGILFVIMIVFVFLAVFYYEYVEYIYDDEEASTK